jgi:HK97 family phage portal protein
VNVGLRAAQAVANRLWSAGRRVERKASKAGRLIATQVLGQPVWTPRQYDELAKESYTVNAVAFRAIAEIAKCAGSVPFALFEGKGKSRRQIDKHPLLDLLTRPNPMQSRAAFMQAIVGFFLISGNSYIERVGPFRGPPKELWPKRPDRMIVKAGKSGTPDAYIFKVGSGEVVWPVNALTRDSAILHIKSFHPLNDWYGMSPVEAAAFAVDQHNEAGKWNMRLLQNSARPSGAFIVDPKAAVGLDDQQYQRLKQEILLHTGPDNAGEPFLLEGGVDWREMGLKPIEMDWLEGKHTSARDIAMVFGMPAQMLGIPGDNTHRNMEEARLWLWEQTILPLLDFFLVEWNWWLTPRFGEDLELAYDTDEIPALITRRFVLWDKVQRADFLRLNEKRKAVGYEPDPRGEVILVPKNRIVLGEEEPESSEPPSPTKAPPSKANGKDKDAPA